MGLALGGGVLQDPMGTAGPFSSSNIVLMAVIVFSRLMLVGLAVTAMAALAAIGYRLRQQETFLPIS